jgi:hypothetical protein
MELYLADIGGWTGLLNCLTAGRSYRGVLFVGSFKYLQHGKLNGYDDLHPAQIQPTRHCLHKMHRLAASAAHCYASHAIFGLGALASRLSHLKILLQNSFAASSVRTFLPCAWHPCAPDEVQCTLASQLSQICTHVIDRFSKHIVCNPQNVYVT